MASKNVSQRWGGKRDQMLSPGSVPGRAFSSTVSLVPYRPEQCFDPQRTRTGVHRPVLIAHFISIFTSFSTSTARCGARCPKFENSVLGASKIQIRNTGPEKHGNFLDLDNLLTIVKESETTKNAT